LLDAADEVGTHAMRQKSRAIDRHRRPTTATARTAAQATYRLCQHVLDGVVRQAPQKTVHRGVIGHARQLQDSTQFAMLAQAHFGFSKGPVFVAHQTKNRQQLRLGEKVFAETTAVGRQSRAGDLQGRTGKGQESDLWHPTSCLTRKHSHPPPVEPLQLTLYRRCQQSSLASQFS
jgi:hypothetical protein